jgi:hypothetical protein
VLVIHHQGGQWLAQGVDFDLCTQAPSDELAIASFRRIFYARYHKDVELGREPFESLPDAPKHFAEEWDRIIRSRPVRMVPAEDDGPDGMPTYIIPAVAGDYSDSNLSH